MSPEEWTNNLRAAVEAVWKMGDQEIDLLLYAVTKRQSQLRRGLPWQLKHGSVLAPMAID